MDHDPLQWDNQKLVSQSSRIRLYRAANICLLAVIVFSCVYQYLTNKKMNQNTRKKYVTICIVLSEAPQSNMFFLCFDSFSCLLFTC